MNKKTQPSVSKSVELINACVNHKLVKSKHLHSITDTHIDFLVPATKKISHPLNYALQCLWRNLGQQASTSYSKSDGVVAVYEWCFAPPAGKLQLRFTNDHQAILRLVNTQVERRAR